MYKSPNAPFQPHCQALSASERPDQPEEKAPKNKVKEAALYKTEYCRNWTELGHCRYGKKCCYAHGSSELRAAPRHNRYKTQICRAYHVEGSCPYGIRCTFIHDTFDAIPPLPALSPPAKHAAKIPDILDYPQQDIWNSKLGLATNYTIGTQRRRKDSFGSVSSDGNASDDSLLPDLGFSFNASLYKKDIVRPDDIHRKIRPLVISDRLGSTFW